MIENSLMAVDINYLWKAVNSLFPSKKVDFLSLSNIINKENSIKIAYSFFSKSNTQDFSYILEKFGYLHRNKKLLFVNIFIDNYRQFL